MAAEPVPSTIATVLASGADSDNAPFLEPEAVVAIVDGTATIPTSTSILRFILEHLLKLEDDACLLKAAARASPEAASLAAQVEPSDAPSMTSMPMGPAASSDPAGSAMMAIGPFAGEGAGRGGGGARDDGVHVPGGAPTSTRRPCSPHPAAAAAA